MLLLAVVLTCFGIVMVYSASSIMAAKRFSDGFFFLKRQGAYAAVGFLLLAVLMRIDYRHLRRLAVPGFLASLLLLGVMLIPGVGTQIGGASRWLRIGGVSIQPSELAKLGLVFFLAHSLAKKGDGVAEFKKGFLPYMGILVALLGLLLGQPDLGSALTMGLVAVIMLVVSGTRWRYLLGTAALALPLLYWLVMSVDYRRRRILAFLNPWDDPTNAGFQIIQSWIAFGTGGLFGKGLGESRQKMFFLPEAHTDFIFSVVGEELGFAGVLVIAAMFLVLVVRGFRASLEAPDEFGRLLGFGLVLLLGIEAFTNIAVVLGLLPTKGLALPFLSFGGTSLVTSLAAVGILLNISAQGPGAIR